MNGGAKILACAAVLAVAGCGGSEGKLTVRPIKQPLAAGEQPVPVRIAEARAQMALGNVGLALESYRKAWRDDPRSVEAMAGMAACYDRMGRFDLSRRHYEAALAVEPANTAVLAALAASLDQQGKRSEAEAVRGEIRQRLAAAAPAEAAPQAVEEIVETRFAEREPEIDSRALQPGSGAAPLPASAVFEVEAPRVAALAPGAVEPAPPAPALPQVAARSVTITLPPARPAAPAEARLPAERLAAVEAPRSAAPRLERLSLGEVALVTKGAPQWRPQVVASTSRSATIRFVPLRQAQRPVPIRLLNAARVDGLAARTRSQLASRGWKGIFIGNARTTRARSVILYPSESRGTAQRLAAQFGFATAQRPGWREVTVLLGRDAAARKRPAA